MAGRGTTLLNAVTGTGTGNAFKLPRVRREHTVQVIVTGSPSAVTVDFEGSLDGITFFQLAVQLFSAAEITAQASMIHITNKPVTVIRANLVILTGGASPTVTVTSMSVQ